MRGLFGGESLSRAASGARRTCAFGSKHKRVHTLAIGYLDPIDTISGVQARLLALGYWPGDPGDVDVDHLQGDLEKAFGC